jgi:hypothetical protein
LLCFPNKLYFVCFTVCRVSFFSHQCENCTELFSCYEITNAEFYAFFVMSDMAAFCI